MLGDESLWAAVGPALADRAAVRPARTDLDGSVPAIASRVLADAPPRFALGGHSFGAIVALEIVRRAPERLSRLALLTASARPPTEEQLASWARLERRLGNGDFGRLAHDFALASVPQRRRGDSELVARVEAMAHTVGPDGLRRQLAAQRTRPDSRPALGAISIPTLVLTGAEDRICPPALQEELAGGIPRAQRATVADAGHMAALEAPDAVAGHLLRWLGR
jgi:pimeloyl-ACP methyl ester carboxylesterase